MPTPPPPIFCYRSRPVCRSSTREQFNEITAYIDASNVYGSEQEHSAVLRTYRDGKLQKNSNTEQLPSREQLNLRPNTQLLRPESGMDLMAGDIRANEHPFLSSLHTGKYITWWFISPLYYTTSFL